MNSSLLRFFKEFTVQLRLIIGHWSYWVMHLVFALLMFALFGLPGGRDAEGLLTASLGTVSAGLIMLVCILLSGMAASRASQNRFMELAESFPTGCEVMLGGWLASLTAGLGLLIEPLVMAGFMGSWDTLLPGLFPFLWYTLVSSLLGSAFTWWIAGLLKFKRWIYPLLAAAWAVIWLGPMFISRAGFDLTLVDIPTRMQNADYDAIYGRLEPSALANWFCVFIAASGLVLLAAAAWRVSSRRKQRLAAAGAFGVVFAAALAVVAGLQFTSVMTDLDHRLETNADNNLPVVAQSEARITTYDIDVDLVSAALPRVSVTFTLENLEDAPRADWPMALNHNFKILSASVPYSFNQGVFEVHLPEPLAPRETVEISLSYEGSFTTYTDGPQIPVANQFLEDQKVRLGLYSFWLPVAGSDNITQVVNDGSLVDPAIFQLSLKTPPGVTSYTNLGKKASGEYESQAANYLFWAASPRLVEKKAGQLNVYGTAGEIEQAAPFYQQIESFYQKMQALFPAVKAEPAALLIFETRNGMPYSSIKKTSMSPVLVIPNLFFSYWDQSETAQWSTTAAIGDAFLNSFYEMSGGTTLSGPSLELAGRFLWVYFEYDRDPAAIRAAQTDIQPLEEILLRAVEKDGEPGLVKALETLRNAPENLEDSDAVAEWLKASLNVQ